MNIGHIFSVNAQLHCAVERVVISQNEFWDSALAYFNVFSEWVSFLQLLDSGDFYGGKWVFKIPIL